DGILPLSGDCLLWRKSTDELAVRVGFETFALATIDGTGAMTDFVPFSDVPLYAYANSVLALRYGDYTEATSSYAVSYVLETLDQMDIAVDDGYELGDATEPFTGVSFADGALFAPLSHDPAFPSIEVGFRSPTQAMTTIASIARTSTDALYSARAFSSG